MRHVALPTFWEAYRALPKKVQSLADKNYQLLKADPLHPSLRFKRLATTEPLWSVRVGSHYRALGLYRGDLVEWFWIGPHSQYDKLLS
jgi:hypothetical protein